MNFVSKCNVFNPNSTKYGFIKKRSKGNGDGEITVPYSVDVDSKGDVWVADRGNQQYSKI